MKNLILAAVTVLVTQSAMASELRVMKFDGKNTYNPAGQEKIQLISASNVGSTSIINAVTASMMCQVLVANIGEAAAVISAISSKSILECYVRDENKVGGRTQFLTRDMMIIRDEQ